MLDNCALKDGEYPCNATLHIKDGKAIIVLHSMFGLEPGNTIPLYREEHELKVETGGGEPKRIGLKNGHAII
ncbi:hypothetical protein [Candidatus Electronema sp. TJ]|uniref:hypothetical protein n=1 Tax=Candidatus Electronema sp. TJ TaxID=3401573 RepID=UPI003AA9360D